MNQREIQELNNSMNEILKMPSTCDIENIYSTIDQGIERISELEDKSFEITQ